MALTEARRRANNKYIKEHMTILAVKVRKDYAEKVKAVCEERGTTVNAVLKEALEKFMRE